MNLCTKCGTKNYDGDKFCGKCGVKIDVPEMSPFMTQAGFSVAEVRSNLGVVYFKMGRYAEALDEFKKVLVRNPNDARALDMVLQIEEKQNSSLQKK